MTEAHHHDHHHLDHGHSHDHASNPVNSQVTEISPVMVRVQVEVPWDHVSQHLSQTYQQLQKRAHVKGFRPGKAPRKVIEQLYRERIENDVLGTLVEEGLIAAMRQHALTPVAQPQVMMPKLIVGQPVSFSAEVEVRPKIEKIKLDGIRLTKKNYPIDDAQVQTELEKLQERAAAFAAVSPARPAAKGDVVLANYTVVVDGVKRDDMAAKDRIIALDEDALLPEFEAGILGKNAGDRSSVSVVFSNDYWQSEFREKTAVFDIEVLEVREKHLPALDDAFAKQLGFETLDLLRERVRKELEEGARARTEDELKEQIVDGVVAHNDVPIPPSMLAAQKQSMVREYVQLMQMSGQDLSDLQKPEVLESFDKRAERQVKASLLFTEIAQQHNLKVSAEDIDAEVAKIAERTGKHLAKVRVEYQQGDRAERLAAKLLEDKITAKVLESASVSEETATSAA